LSLAGRSGQTIKGDVEVKKTVTTDSIKITQNPTDGYVLQSDASGVATWADVKTPGDVFGFPAWAYVYRTVSSYATFSITQNTYANIGSAFTNTSSVLQNCTWDSTNKGIKVTNAGEYFVSYNVSVSPASTNRVWIDLYVNGAAVGGGATNVRAAMDSSGSGPYSLGGSALIPLDALDVIQLFLTVSTDSVDAYVYDASFSTLRIQ